MLIECGNMLLREGYKIRILNTINFKKSMHFNPFAYIHPEKDILKMVTTLIANTSHGVSFESSIGILISENMVNLAYYIIEFSFLYTVGRTPVFLLNTFVK